MFEPSFSKYPYIIELIRKKYSRESRTIQSKIKKPTALSNPYYYNIADLKIPFYFFYVNIPFQDINIDEDIRITGVKSMLSEYLPLSDLENLAKYNSNPRKNHSFKGFFKENTGFEFLSKPSSFAFEMSSFKKSSSSSPKPPNITELPKKFTDSNFRKTISYSNIALKKNY
ncbi:hypothetical protein AYI68_g8091 [Smittium mucronatum]|uniref:Uncharacterized protein n=1 Tax=Smittium mucronatum TaxID=133383 RepID=A0A1R0GLV0_9FUNG|nr:hypothetical protein AYI68_g8091 [Smittium mucronatum]